MDINYIRIIGIQIPPKTGGMEKNIDKLIMLLTRQESIQKVIFFHQIKVRNNKCNILIKFKIMSIYTKNHIPFYF